MLDGAFGLGDAKFDIERLASPGEGGVVGYVQVKAHETKDRRDETLGLAKREVVDEAKGQRHLDGEVGVFGLATALVCGRCIPFLDGRVVNPKRDAATVDEGLIVFGGVGQTILGFVRWVDVGTFGCHGTISSWVPPV